MKPANKKPRGVNFHDDILILEKAQLDRIKQIVNELPGGMFGYGKALWEVVADIEEINQDDVTL